MTKAKNTTMRKVMILIVAVVFAMVSACSTTLAASSPEKAKDPVTYGHIKTPHIAVTKVNKKAKTVTIKKYVSIHGTKHQVTAIGKKAFRGCKKLRTIKVKATKALTVQKGAFKGLNTKKITVKVTKKMSKKQFNKFKKNLKKAGFKGKVKRVTLK